MSRLRKDGGKWKMVKFIKSGKSLKKLNLQKWLSWYGSTIYLTQNSHFVHFIHFCSFSMYFKFWQLGKDGGQWKKVKFIENCQILNKVMKITKSCLQRHFCLFWGIPPTFYFLGVWICSKIHFSYIFDFFKSWDGTRRAIF